MNKRGQFFLVAAMIIIGLVIGLATAVNSVEVGSRNEAFYDLAEEIGFETKQVLDYGVFNVGTDTNDLMRGFLENYTSHIAAGQVVFVFGDINGLEALYFENVGVGGVGINTGTPISGTITITDWLGQQLDLTEIDADGDTEPDLVTVLVNDITYEFPLRHGTDLFYLLIKEENNDKFVATG